jgi:hypothetical protein
MKDPIFEKDFRNCGLTSAYPLFCRPVETSEAQKRYLAFAGRAPSPAETPVAAYGVPLVWFRPQIRGFTKTLPPAPASGPAKPRSTLPPTCIDLK